MDENEKKEIQRMIDLAVNKAVGFNTRKLGDTPTDAYQLTPLKYVTMNGSVASRPASVAATVGEFYLNTQNNIPMWFTNNNNWVNATGSVVASN